jgi:hypothetical protein
MIAPDCRRHLHCSRMRLSVSHGYASPWLALGLPGCSLHPGSPPLSALPAAKSLVFDNFFSLQFQWLVDC